MAKARSGKARSGGGLTSNKLVRPKIKAGPPRTNVISPSAVADIGASIGYKRLPLIKGTAPQVPMGNDLATNVGRGAPGAGRTIYPSGYQCQTGPAAPGQKGIEGKADRGSRAILGPPSNTGAVRRGQQRGE
jgi:hypothetical protein